MSSLRARFEQLSDEDYERAVRELAELAAELAEETGSSIPDEVGEIRNTPVGELRRPEPTVPPLLVRASGLDTTDPTDPMMPTEREFELTDNTDLGRIMKFFRSPIFKDAQIRQVAVSPSFKRIDITVYADRPSQVFTAEENFKTGRINLEIRSFLEEELPISLLVIDTKTRTAFNPGRKTWQADHLLVNRKGARQRIPERAPRFAD